VEGEEDFFYGGEFVLEVGEGVDFVEGGVVAPEVGEELAAGDGGLGVFESAGVGGVAVVESEDGAGLEPDDGVVAAKFGGQCRADVAPVIVNAFGPVCGSVDCAAIQEKNFIQIARRRPLFLIDLQAINFPLHVTPARQIELIPTGLQGVVNLGGGFGDQYKPIRMCGGDFLCDHRFAGSGAAGENDPANLRFGSSGHLWAAGW
jgi:hypothetical protein